MPVYFIRSGEDGPVKIGIAEEPRSRMRDLQVGNPVELLMIREITGGAPEESWLHRHYGDLRLRGEWFKFCASMLTIVPPADLPAASPRGENTQAARVLSRFPSQAALARFLGISASVVSSWADTGFIPAQRQDALFDAADKLGVDLQPEDFFPSLATAA
jgi:hypothetical protein